MSSYPNHCLLHAAQQVPTCSLMAARFIRTQNQVDMGRPYILLGYCQGWPEPPSCTAVFLGCSMWFCIARFHRVMTGVPDSSAYEDRSWGERSSCSYMCLEPRHLVIGSRHGRQTSGSVSTGRSDRAGRAREGYYQPLSVNHNLLDLLAHGYQSCQALLWHLLTWLCLLEDEVAIQFNSRWPRSAGARTDQPSISRGPTACTVLVVYPADK